MKRIAASFYAALAGAALFAAEPAQDTLIAHRGESVDALDPAVEAKYRKALGYSGTVERMERFAFYERAKKAYAVVISGETAKYGNIILKKGVTPMATEFTA